MKINFFRISAISLCYLLLVFFIFLGVTEYRKEEIEETKEVRIHDGTLYLCNGDCERFIEPRHFISSATTTLGSSIKKDFCQNKPKYEMSYEDFRMCELLMEDNKCEPFENDDIKITEDCRFGITTSSPKTVPRNH